VDDTVDPTRLAEATLTALLGRADSLFCALADDGFRVAVPGALDVPDHRQIPVPHDRATMLDLVVPDDRMRVVTTWERARRNRIAMAPVRPVDDPDRTYTLTILDARDSCGSWVGALSAGDHFDTTSTGKVLTGALRPPRRPRTAVIRKNGFAIIAAIDERVPRMLGWTAEEMVGARSLDFIHPDDQERALTNWLEMLANHEPQRVRYRHRCSDGGWLWVEVEHVYRHDDDFDGIVVTAQLSDISDEMAAHEAVHRREQLFHRLAESLPTGVMQVEADGWIVYANARLGSIMGVGGVPTVAEQMANVLPGDRALITAACDSVLERGVDQQVEVSLRLPDSGDVRRCRLIFTSLGSDGDAAGALICVSDVTESARLREELRRRATYDALTGCHNRASIIAALDDALATNPPGAVAAVFVDLDRFKSVNDDLGHRAGDELLSSVADAIRSVVRAGDVVGRLGGDEFLVLCPGLDRRDEACAIAERISGVLHRVMDLRNGCVNLSASVGVAFSSHGTTSGALVARADAAMYESKRRRAGRPVVDSA
jgi:diguanylate cyclase (GGDEF)-like protein/PAS domain S-box-containing protein